MQVLIKRRSEVVNCIIMIWAQLNHYDLDANFQLKDWDDSEGKRDGTAVPGHSLEWDRDRNSKFGAR